MGSGDDYPKKSQQSSNNNLSRLKVLLLLLISNLLTLYIFSGPSLSFSLRHYTQGLPIWDFYSLLTELNNTQARLAASNARLVELHATANSHLVEFLSEISHAREVSESQQQQQPGALLASGSWSDEVRLVLKAHKLPLGFAPKFGSDEIFPPAGAACLRYPDELTKYMTYNVGGECPSDEVFAQRLMLKGCEPLPRRRCHPKSPVGYVEPRPVSESLWATPPDTSLTWDAYTCKSYKCLIDRIKTKNFYDCKDCFFLNGREKNRWLFDQGLDYGIDKVLNAKPAGTVRIGIDLGGGSGTFAVRMRERNVTIITSTMNFDGPFNSFIASRGLIPMHISISHRLPFYDNILDIVHSMHVLNNWIPDTVLEFALYDIYRVLRPGGLFWLDRFFCYGSQLNQTYVPMIEGVGFRKLRWDIGRKLDKGIQKDEWYLSALLEKPMT